MTETRISHGSGQMRAQSISIQVSDRERCNAGCKFCISRTTPGSDDVNPRDVKLCEQTRLRVGLNYARHLGATHAILTGRADPLQEDVSYICDLVHECRKHLPLVDMHTNGYRLHSDDDPAERLELFASLGLTMITFSIASFDDDENRELMKGKHHAKELISMARDAGLLVRCSLVMNREGVNHFDDVYDYIVQAGELGAHQVVVREVWTPDVYGKYNEDVYAWNRDNKVDIVPVQEMFMAAAKGNEIGIRQLAPLPWGTPVFSVEGVFQDAGHGVNVTFAICDEATAGTVMKSIVHRPDGHGYRNWDSKGDILY